MSSKRPTPLTSKVKQEKTYNKYSYLTKLERAWIAGVIDTAGIIETTRIVRIRKFGKLLTYRCRVRAGLRINNTIMVLGRMLNITVRDYSKQANPRYELVINHANLDPLMALLKPYITPEKYNEYVKAKNDSDLTSFKLREQGWVMDLDGQLTGPRHVYRGVDFAAIDAYFANNPTSPEKVQKQIEYLLAGVEKGPEDDSDELDE